VEAMLSGQTGITVSPGFVACVRAEEELLSAGDCGARQIQKAGIKANTTDVTAKDLSSEWSRNVLPVKRLRRHA